MTKEQIEGSPVLIASPPAGYTRSIAKVPADGGAFASQGLSKPYGNVLGPAVLADGRTYVAITESHFDDHVTNPRTGLKDEHWHKGVSLFVRADQA